jgi:hypothetical protein
MLNHNALSRKRALAKKLRMVHWERSIEPCDHVKQVRSSLAMGQSKFGQYRTGWIYLFVKDKELIASTNDEISTT